MYKIICTIILGVLICVPANAGHWFGGDFVDQFGDTTDKAYIKYDVGRCKMVVSETNGVSIFPGRHQITGGKVLMKNSDGEIIRVTIYERSKGFKLGGYESVAVVEFLKDSVGIVRVLIIDQFNKKYTFKVDVTGFTASWNWLNQQ